MKQILPISQTINEMNKSEAVMMDFLFVIAAPS